MSGKCQGILDQLKCGNPVLCKITCGAGLWLAEWYTVLCLPHRRSWVCAPNLHQCLWTHLQVYGLKRLSYHADLYTGSRCCSWGESEDHKGKQESTQKGSTLALKHRADITRSPKQGYQCPHEKDLGPPKLTKKTTKNKINLRMVIVTGARCHRTRWVQDPEEFASEISPRNTGYYVTRPLYPLSTFCMIYLSEWFGLKATRTADRRRTLRRHVDCEAGRAVSGGVSAVEHRRLRR